MRFNGLKAFVITPIVLCGTAAVFVARPAAAQNTGKSTRPSSAAFQSADEAYAAAFTAIVRDYRNVASAGRQHPMPASLSLPERRAFIDRRMNEMMNADLSYARRLDALKPPTRFKGIHVAARAFFLTSANSVRDFSTAMHAGDRNAANAAWARVERAQQLFNQRCQEAKQASRR